MRMWAWAMVAALVLVGCQKKSTPQLTKGPAFKVALILPGSEADHAWNQMAKEGLDRIAKELGAETKFVSNVKANDFAARIDYFAQDGYDVIICHGGEFQQAVSEAVKRYPKPHYIVGGCSEAIPGATSVEFQALQASELVGVVTAVVSRTHVAAFVGAEQMPTVQACYDGMKKGLELSSDLAQAKALETKLLPAQWTGSWDSPTLAKEKTEAVLAAGADCVYQNVDAAAPGVFEAVKKANSPAKPVYAFGCNSNQNAQAPDVILGSVVINVPQAYLDLAQTAKQGVISKGVVKLGLRGGYVDLVLNDKHPAVTAAVRQKVDDARKRLIAK